MLVSCCNTALCHKPEGEPYCFRFQCEVEAAGSSEMLVTYYNTIWCHNPEDLNLKKFTVMESSDTSTIITYATTGLHSSLVHIFTTYSTSKMVTSSEVFHHILYVFLFPMHSTCAIHLIPLY